MVSGTNDRFLNMGVAIREVYAKVEPNLIFNDWLEGPVQEDKAAFIYLYDSENTSSDSKKQTAPRFVVGADLPRIDFSVPSTASAITEAKGFEVALPRAIVRDGVAGRNAILRTYQKAGFILAEQMNTAALSAITAGATTPTWTPTAVWSDDTATPVKDLMDFAKVFDQEGYPYKFTDGFVNKDGFYELKEYLNFLDGTQFNDQRPVGTMIDRDTIYVKQADATIHKVMSGMTDSYLLGMDKNNLGAEMHTYSDPSFAMTGASVSYPTIENGKTVTKSAPNLGLHFYSYMEDDTKDTIMQFWFENKVVVTQALALQYDSGI